LAVVSRGERERERERFTNLFIEVNKTLLESKGEMGWEKIMERRRLDTKTVTGSRQLMLCKAQTHHHTNHQIKGKAVLMLR
jgi:hypothetical protein